MPGPPPYYGIPAHTAHITIAITGAIAAATVAFCIWYAVTRRDPLAVILLIAGGLTVFALEPFTDVLGSAVFPEAHQIGWIHALGRHIPMYIGLIYLFYWAPAWLFIVRRFDRGITGREYAGICAGLVISACLIELIPVHFKLWTYYGSQPLRIGGFPIWWAFVNGHSLIASATALYFLLKVLPQSRRFLLIAIMPAVVIATHTLAAVVGYLTVGSTSATHGTAATYAGTLGSIALSLTMMWVYWTAVRAYHRFVTLPAADGKPAPAPQPAVFPSGTAAH